MSNPTNHIFVIKGTRMSDRADTGAGCQTSFGTYTTLLRVFQALKASIRDDLSSVQDIRISTYDGDIKFTWKNLQNEMKTGSDYRSAYLIVSRFGVETEFLIEPSYVNSRIALY